jgi:hypothetical protein
MQRLLLAAALTLLLPAEGRATWSIIAVDRNTGRVVISSATCAAQGPDELKIVQAVVVPGIGVAAAQAGVDRSHTNQKLIFEQMRGGTDPREIIRLLSLDPSFQSRQFGIVDLQGRRAGHTGSGNRDVAMHISGESADGIVFSVQGNIIKTDSALIEAARIMREGGGDMVDRVMLAMEAADARGGDSRCTCETEPLPGAGCNGKTAHVAYILAADRDDARGTYAEGHPQIPPVGAPPAQAESVCRGENAQKLCEAPWNSGKYWLYLAVYPSNVQPHEDANPVRTLRMRYDAWKRTQRSP